MSFSIKEIKINNEFRVKLLFQVSVPVYWPNLFILKNMRVRSPNTQQRFLSDLVIFLDWLNYEEIDLESRLKKRPRSEYLKSAELAKLSSLIYWKSKTLKKIYNKEIMHPSAYQQVSTMQVVSRMISVKTYLSFLYSYLGSQSDSFENINKMKSYLDLEIKSTRPAWKKRPSKPKGLTEVQEDIVLNKLHPESLENPWPRCEKIKMRNYVIVLLLFFLGIRRSELLGIKLKDIDYSKNYIDIISRPNDIEDTRTSEPLVKTNERKLPVPDYLMVIINYYIENHRYSRRSRNHPYLIVSHGRTEGAPLSIKSIDPIFNVAKKYFPELEGITAHSFRHNDVYRTVKFIYEQTEGEATEDRMEKERRILTTKYGWSDSSRMPSLYGQKYYQEEAEKAMIKRNNELLHNKK